MAVLPSGGCAFVIVEVRWQPSYCAAPMPRSCFLASRKSRASSPAPKGRPFLRCLPSCSHATPCCWCGGWLFEEYSQASSMAGRRSEEGRGGKECDSTCRSRWSQYHEKKKLNQMKQVHRRRIK